MQASPHAPSSERDSAKTPPHSTTNERYTRTAVVLHWLIATMVFVQFGWGWWMQTIAKIPVGPRVNAYNLHKSVGLTILALAVIRLLWRATHRAPALPPMPAWQHRAARINHGILYLVIIAMPVVGYLGSAFSGYPVKYFGLTIPAWSAKHDALKDLMSQVHLALSILLAGSVLVHVGAVIKHALESGRTLLSRMTWSRAR